MTDPNSIKYYNQPTYPSPTPEQPAPAVSSRRARFEQKRLLTQTALFAGLAVIVLAIGALVVIPYVIRSLGGNSPIATTDSPTNLPLQPPELDAPVSATFSSQVTIQGFSDQGKQVVLLNNGQEVAKQDVASDGSFQFPLDLQSGDNKVSAYAINGSRKSSPSQEYTVTFDNTPPKLEIKQPQDKQSFQGKANRTVTIQGDTEPNARVYLNDRIVFIREDGTFSTDVRLETGDNPLDIRAVDEAGNTTEVKLTVSYSD